MKCWYKVLGCGDVVYCVDSQAELSDLDFIANPGLSSECACHYYSVHEGYKRTWPLTFALHSDKGGVELARTEVDMRFLNADKLYYAIKPQLDLLRPQVEGYIFDRCGIERDSIESMTALATSTSNFYYKRWRLRKVKAVAQAAKELKRKCEPSAAGGVSELLLEMQAAPWRLAEVVKGLTAAGMEFKAMAYVGDLQAGGVMAGGKRWEFFLTNFALKNYLRIAMRGIVHPILFKIAADCKVSLKRMDAHRIRKPVSLTAISAPKAPAMVEVLWDGNGRFISTAMTNHWLAPQVFCHDGVELRDSKIIGCNEADRFVVFLRFGSCAVARVSEKFHMDNAIVLDKQSDDTIYSVFYREKVTGSAYAKRFKIDRRVVGDEFRIIPDGCQLVVVGCGNEFSYCELAPTSHRPDDFRLVNFDEVPVGAVEDHGVIVSISTVPKRPFHSFKRLNEKPLEDGLEVICDKEFDHRVTMRNNNLIDIERISDKKAVGFGCFNNFRGDSVALSMLYTDASGAFYAKKFKIDRTFVKGGQSVKKYKMLQDSCTSYRIWASDNMPLICDLKHSPAASSYAMFVNFPGVPICSGDEAGVLVTDRPVIGLRFEGRKGPEIEKLRLKGLIGENNPPVMPLTPEMFSETTNAPASIAEALKTSVIEKEVVLERQLSFDLSLDTPPAQTIVKPDANEESIVFKRSGIDEVVPITPMRSNKDKRLAVENALKARPELSDRGIAAHCGVSTTFVGAIRKQLFTLNSDDNPTRIGLDGIRRSMPTEQAVKSEITPIASSVEAVSQFSRQPVVENQFPDTAIASDFEMARVSSTAQSKEANRLEKSLAFLNNWNRKYNASSIASPLDNEVRDDTTAPECEQPVEVQDPRGKVVIEQHGLWTLKIIYSEDT